MSTSIRPGTPPAGSRLAGLPRDVIQRVIQTAQALEAGRPDDAALQLRGVLAAHLGHPELLRLLAGIHRLRGEHAAALVAMRAAVAQRPLDALYQSSFGTVLAAAGEYDEAAGAFRRAGELEPGFADAWYNLGVLLVRCVRNDEATVALHRALSLQPQNTAARTQLADLLRASNHPAEAAAEYRSVLAQRPCAGMAWWGLADLKTLAFADSDISAMQRALQDPHATDDDRIATGFALARALDGGGRYAQSLEAIEAANVVARRRAQWNASAFSSQVAQLDATFASLQAPAATADDLGAGVVFIVSLPRSGSTLIEQILASHPAVEGAGELPDLPLVLSAESRRRGAPLQAWASALPREDWRRLGAEYLERTRRWSVQRPLFTDKLPSNWYHIGAIRRMLPAARIIVARRDPLETCFSCYRQYLNDNEYTRTFVDLADYWRVFDRSAKAALARYPDHVHESVYEDLLADPEARIRSLLSFCGLPFDPACLDFHRTERDVRSPSAMQVREPLRRDTVHSTRYGALLDPLRLALGLSVYPPA